MGKVSIIFVLCLLSKLLKHIYKFKLLKTNQGLETVGSARINIFFPLFCGKY